MNTARIGPDTLQRAREFLVDAETSITSRMLARHLELTEDSARRALRSLVHLGEVQQLRSQPGGQFEALYHVKGRAMIQPPHMDTEQAHATGKLIPQRRRLANPSQRTVKKWSEPPPAPDDLTAALFGKRSAS